MTPEQIRDIAVQAYAEYFEEDFDECSEAEKLLWDNVVKTTIHEYIQLAGG